LKNTYEVLIVFKPILDVENVDAILNHFQKNLVEANQGEVLESDRIGRKRLAYEIKKFKDGFLTLYLLKFPPAKVADFRRACQLNDDVLRLTMVRMEEEAAKKLFSEEARRESFTPKRDRDHRGDRGGDRGDRGGRRFGPPGGPGGPGGPGFRPPVGAFSRENRPPAPASSPPAADNE